MRDMMRAHFLRIMCMIMNATKRIVYRHPSTSAILKLVLKIQQWTTDNQLHGIDTSNRIQRILFMNMRYYFLAIQQGC
jgi:hypothetical protein